VENGKRKEWEMDQEKIGKNRNIEFFKKVVKFETHHSAYLV
jgi:hypothetical protein